MAEQATPYIDRLQAQFAEATLHIAEDRGEVSLELPPAQWHAACLSLRDDYGFEQLVDLCGLDYLGYGSDEWETEDVSSEGFSRGVEAGHGPGRFNWDNRPQGETSVHRFAVVAHLRSYQHNRVLRVRCLAADDDLPVVESVTDIWPGANWFEREAFDLFGIVFQGHPDLRRILTDYGFVGHPFRKDFPLIGNVEVRYDEEKKRVVYEPVTSVVPRVLVPRVIRDDSRYATAAGEAAGRPGGKP